MIVAPAPDNGSYFGTFSTYPISRIVNNGFYLLFEVGIIVFRWKAFKLTIFCTIKCHPKKSKPLVVGVICVFFLLIFMPRSARNVFIFAKISVSSSSGFRKKIISSAYLTEGWRSSMPLSAIFANNGLITPP